jgi:hypothetical protein
VKTKLLQINFIAVLFLISAADLKSQDNLSQTLESIRSKVQDVQIDKTTFKQSIEILDGKKGKLAFLSETSDDKGRTSRERYEFYLSDIDKNTVIRKTSGKKLFISLSVDNNQKFIKHFREDKLDGYTSSIEILLSGTDAAQDLVNLFTAAIPMAGMTEKVGETSTDALNWLKKNISTVNSGAVTFEQSFSFGDRKEYLAVFNVKKTDQKGVSADMNYEFSILDINAKKLTIKVSGTELSVSFETKGNDPYIKYSKNNEQQSFENNFQIVAEDIEQAHNIIAAFSVAIEKSKPAWSDFSSLQKSLDFITKNTADLTVDKKSIGQKINFVPGSGTKSVFTYTEPDSKGKTVEERYEFYLSDIDANSMNFKVSGKKITLIPVTRNKAKFIRYYKDNQLQDFQNELGILITDIENAREMAEAFKSAIKSSPAELLTWKNNDDAIKYLTANITGETIGSDVYKLNLTAISNGPLNLRYVVDKTDSKGTKGEDSFEFYPYMLDTATIKIVSSGKYLNVEVSATGKMKFVKVFKEDKQQSYDDGIEIMAFDARQAQDIAETIKYLAQNSKPKEMTWSDKQSVIKFITENVVDIKSEGKEVKQKTGLINNDPCRFSLTVSATDEKGKTTDEIFEFTLSDMNKQAVDLKVSGKKVEVTVPCKNKEKLVKVYKNGEQQAWGSAADFELNDVEIARNVADAFRSAIAQCQK